MTYHTILHHTVCLHVFTSYEATARTQDADMRISESTLQLLFVKPLPQRATAKKAVTVQSDMCTNVLNLTKREYAQIKNANCHI